MKNKFNYRSECIVCKNNQITEIIQLGEQPFADTFIPANRINEKENTYPLICQLCKNCNNIQLKHITNPNLRYNDYEYSYTSSNSNFATSHWDDFFLDIKKKYLINQDTKILEIGSNDGYLLNNFKSITKKIVGLDASKKMTSVSSKKGIFSINGILNDNSKKLISKKFKKFDLIIANNVINHMDNLISSLKIVKSLLNNNGSFIFEQPYWLDTIQTKRYDQIYHEHITYFTVSFAKNLAKILGMNFYDFEIINYHGKSIRLYFSKSSQNKLFLVNKKKISKQISLEVKLNLFNIRYYKKFMNYIIINRNKVLEKILYYKNKGHKIICIGAAAKSNTWLNFHKLDSSIISYITDRSPNKINKFTPLSRIKILNDNKIKKEKHPVIIILTWNIYEILSNKIKSINKLAKFLKV